MILNDKATRHTNEECLDTILDCIKDHVKHDASIFTKFVDILRDLNQQDLADAMISKYKGIIHYECNGIEGFKLVQFY